MVTLTEREYDALPRADRLQIARLDAQGRATIVRPPKVAALAATVHPARESLAGFVEATSTWTLDPWQVWLCDRLEKLRHQAGQRLLIHAPPQNGKSIIVSQRLTPFLLGHDPLHRIKLACYNETHSTAFGEVVLQVMHSEEYATIFPGTHVADRVSAKRWKTAERAGLNDAQDSFRALGLVSGFVGSGADTLIIDDPYRSRDDAFSDLVNEKTWRFYAVTAKHRMGPLSNIVMMYHRWHEDDIAGRAIKEGGWEQIRFPALCDARSDDPTFVMGWRRFGENLTDRWPRKHLEALRDDDPETFLALDQGTPIAEGGNMLKMGLVVDLERDILPGSDEAAMLTVYQGVDFAISLSDMAAYFVIATVGIDQEGNLYLLDVYRDRIGFHEQILAIGSEYEEWLPVECGLEVVQYQAAAFQEASRTLFGSFTEVKVSTDKATRARLLERRIAMGKCYANKSATWWADLEAEGLSFPLGKYKDQIDAITNALHLAPINIEELSQRRRPPEWTLAHPGEEPDAALRRRLGRYRRRTLLAPRPEGLPIMATSTRRLVAEKPTDDENVHLMRDYLQSVGQDDNFSLNNHELGYKLDHLWDDNHTIFHGPLSLGQLQSKIADVMATEAPALRRTRTVRDNPELTQEKLPFLAAKPNEGQKSEEELKAEEEAEDDLHGIPEEEDPSEAPPIGKADKKTDPEKAMRTRSARLAERDALRGLDAEGGLTESERQKADAEAANNAGTKNVPTSDTVGNVPGPRGKTAPESQV